MPHLNIGDKVIICKRYTICAPYWTKDMDKYIGKEATVISIDESDVYLLDIDKGYWRWNLLWLDLVAPATKRQIVTNYDKYYEDINKIASENKLFGLKKGVPCSCTGMNCNDCDLQSGNCAVDRLKWMCKEYRDTKFLKLTNDERKLLEVIPSEFKYIARDKDGNLFAHKLKPMKSSYSWKSPDGKYVDRYLKLTGFKIPFDFVNWYDDESWEIDKLLKL